MEVNRNILAFLFIQYTKKIYAAATNGTTAFPDINTYFPDHKILEENWEMIRDEVLQILEKNKVPQFHEIDRGQEFISNRDDKAWKLLVLKVYGMWIQSNADKCPKTCALLKNMKQVKTINFSILAPGKYIPPHEGPYKGILRYQLPLEVPKGECYIIVDGKQFSWEEGKSAFFDDTFTHEVHNNTNQRRIALLLDIKRNDGLGFFMRIFDWLIYKTFQTVIFLGGGLRKSKI